MASSFSIREYAASMRGTAASPHPLLGAGGFTPMPARRFSWWVDELHAAVRSSPAAARKKRPVSDLFAAAGDGDVQTNEPSDNRWKKPRSEEDEDDDDDDGVRKIKKGILFSSSSPNAPKVSVNKLHPTGYAQTFQIDERQKHINIEHMRMYDFEIWKPGKFKKHTLQCIGGTKTVNAHKSTNFAMVHPEHSILKKDTKRSSITARIINKEKCSNLKGPEAIEMCRKLGKHVILSGVDDILIGNKISSTLPQLQNHCNVYLDNYNETERLLAANTSSDKNKEASFKANQSDRHIYDRGTSESSCATDPLNLIDLNRALPCIPDFNCTFISSSEVPNLEHREDATSDLQILGDVKEAVLKHNRDLYSKSQRLQCELNSCDQGRTINSRSIASLLPDEVTNISDRGMVSPPLNSRGEVTKVYADYERNSVREGTMKGKAPYILPHHTIQYTSQFAENWYTNMNLGNIDHTGREFSSCPCQNQLHAGKPRLHSDINVQHEHAVISHHTMRLMGKNLTVCTTGGKCTETAEEYVNSSIRCHHTTNIFLELPRQGHPFLSLQSQSFSNIQVDAPRTSHDYVGYRMHHSIHRFPEIDVFSGAGIECEDRLRNFSHLHCGRNAPAGFSPLQGNCNTRSLSAMTFLPTFMPHAKQPSVYHANSTWTRNPYPANLLVYPPDGTNFRKEQNQIIRGIAEIPSSVDIVSRDTVRKMTKEHVNNSNNPSGVKYIPRSGPVKLRPGAKHVLEPRKNTDDGNYPPRYSCIPFFVINRGGNILSGQTKRGRKV